MVDQSNSKIEPQEWIIAVLVVIIFVTLGNSIANLINDQVFENLKLYYCPGDKYFIGLDKPLKCVKIISMVRQPFFYLFILFVIVPFFIWEHYYKNKK